MDGFIYILECKALKCCKIGWSKDIAGVEKREATCNTYCPAEIRLVATFPGSMKHERALHRYFRRARIRREWFVISDEVSRLIRAADEIQVDRYLGVVVGGVEPKGSKCEWNPATWIAAAIGKAGSVRQPRAHIYRPKRMRFWNMRFRHPVTQKQITKSSRTEDAKEARRLAYKWCEEWWADFQNLVGNECHDESALATGVARLCVPSPVDMESTNV